MRRRAERGQAMYIVSVALLTMLLVVALAVDSGLAYLRAQQAQTIAEAAARSARPALPDCARAARLAEIAVDVHKPRQGPDLSSQSACDANNAGITVTVEDNFPVFFAQLIGSGSQRHITRQAHVTAPAQAREHLTISRIMVTGYDCTGGYPGFCSPVTDLQLYPTANPIPYQAAATSPLCRADPSRALRLLLRGFHYDFSQVPGDQQGPLPIWIESYARYQDGQMAVLEGRRITVLGPGGDYVDSGKADVPAISGHPGAVGMIHFRLSWYDEDATPHFAVSPTLYFTC